MLLLILPHPELFGKKSSKRLKAEEFERQAKTDFPHHEAWQTALSRKQALDVYIRFAAKATSEEEHKKLTKMRERLLETAPKELTERPKPKHTATSVLPPRNPAAQIEAKVEALKSKAEPQPVPITAPAVVEVAPVQEKKAEAKAEVISVQSKSSLVFGSVEHIKQARKRQSNQTPVKTAAPQEVKAKTKLQPAPIAAPAAVEVVPVQEMKAEAGAKVQLVQSKSPLVFGNIEHIKQARKPRLKQTPVKTAIPLQEVKKAEPQPVPAPAVVEIVPIRQEKTEAQVEVVQSKSPLVFGSVEHIQQARKRQSKQTPVKTATPLREVKKGEPQPVKVPVPSDVKAIPERSEKAEIEVLAAPVSTKSTATLVFGNLEHIQLSRQRRSKSKASAKPSTRKKVTYAEFPACGVIEEEMPINKPRAVAAQQWTLWELIEATGQAA